MWVDAATQVIFSLGPACGCVITLSSYNKFTRDCHRDAVLIALTNSVTSLFSGSQIEIVECICAKMRHLYFGAGMVVFSILGYMAQVTNQDVSEIVAPGSGLAFIVYPEVVSRYCMI